MYSIKCLLIVRGLSFSYFHSRLVVYDCVLLVVKPLKRTLNLRFDKTLKKEKKDLIFLLYHLTKYISSKRSCKKKPLVQS